MGEDTYIYGLSFTDFKNGDCRSSKNLKDSSIYISEFTDEEMKAEKVDVPWPRATNKKVVTGRYSDT